VFRNFNTHASFDKLGSVRKKFLNHKFFMHFTFAKQKVAVLGVT
jgi:hypothetical protein